MGPSLHDAFPAFTLGAEEPHSCTDLPSSTPSVQRACERLCMCVFECVCHFDVTCPASVRRAASVSLSLYCTTSLSAFVLKWVIWELFSRARDVNNRLVLCKFRRVRLCSDVVCLTSSLDDLIAGGQLFSTGVHTCKMHSGQ